MRMPDLFNLWYRTGVAWLVRKVCSRFCEFYSPRSLAFPAYLLSRYRMKSFTSFISYTQQVANNP